MSENFATRLAQENQQLKMILLNLWKKKHFDDRLKNLNKKVTSNKTQHIELKIKLNDLEKKVKIISTNGFTAVLINKCIMFLMVQNIFIQMVYKIIQCLYQLHVFIRLVKSVAIVKLDHVGGMSQNSIKNLRTSYISFTPKLIGDY